MTSRFQYLFCLKGGESLSSGSFGTQEATGATGKRKGTKPGRDKCSAAKMIALNGYIAILEGKQHETEEQSKARISALEAQLATKMQSWRSRLSRNGRLIIKR